MHPSSSSSSSARQCKREISRRFVVGMLVEREIEGIFFPARVTRLTYSDDGDRHAASGSADLVYLDDGNSESDVNLSDIREIREGSDDKSLSLQGPQGSLFGKLQKPLAGLIDDDDDERAKQTPTVVLHNDIDSEVIILNGANNKLAAGGGLRALRYLNRSKPS